MTQLAPGLKRSGDLVRSKGIFDDENLLMNGLVGGSTNKGGKFCSLISG